MSLSVSDCVGYSIIDSMESITDEAQNATLMTKLTQSLVTSLKTSTQAWKMGENSIKIQPYAFHLFLLTPLLTYSLF